MSLDYINTDRNPFKDEALLNTIEDVSSILGYSETTVGGLLFERSGHSPESNMSSWGLQAAVNSNKTYRLCIYNGLVEVSGPDSEVISLRPLHDIVSTSCELPCEIYAFVDATWHRNVTEDGVGNNILGGSGRFLSDAVLRIPVVEATSSSLAYYGAQLLHVNDVIRFPIDRYPIWGMSVGRRYVSDCLLTAKGGGWYIEYHNDKPHFHMPLCSTCSGFYLLARAVSGGYHMTAFSIPFGSAVYTAPGACHCDAGLVGGKYIVGYDISSDFSTANMRCRGNEECMTSINAYQVETL